jgi:O-antigen/teichoic acid export membrane protein
VSDIRLGFPLILGFVLDFVLAGSDRYFIASYLSVRDVGYYVPGYVLGSLIIFVPKALGTSLPQLLYKAVDTNGEVQARAMVNYAIKIFLLLAIPFLFGCLALSRPILTILASREVADKAQWVAPIVCMGTIFYGLNLVLSNVLLVRLKTSALFKMNLFAACFSLLANLIALNFLKTILVAAVTTVLSFLIAFVYTYRIVVREWQLEFDIPSVAKSLGASVIMAGVLLIATRSVEYGNDFVLVGCSIVIGTVTYVGCLFALRMFSEREIYFMKGLLGQLKSAVLFW